MTDKIYYEYNGEVLTVPSERRKEFESRVPSAKMMITYNNENYRVPLSDIDTFAEKVGADNMYYSAFDDKKRYDSKRSSNRYVFEDSNPTIQPLAEQQEEEKPSLWQRLSEGVVRAQNDSLGFTSSPQQTADSIEVAPETNKEMADAVIDSHYRNMEKSAVYIDDIDNEYYANKSEEPKKNFWQKLGDFALNAQTNAMEFDDAYSIQQKKEDREKGQDYIDAKIAQNISAKVDDKVNEYKNPSKTFVGGVLKGAKDAITDLDTWDASIGLEQAARVHSITKKLDNGESLTKGEQMIVDALVDDLSSDIYLSSEFGRGYKAGKVTGESLPFMIETALNPASKLGGAITKKFGKEIFKKVSTKIGSQIARAAVYGTRVGADLAGAAAMSATTSQARIMEDALNRLSGQVDFTIGDDGTLNFNGFTGGEDTAFKAYAKAYGANTIEHFSEMIGNYFAPIGQMVKKGTANLAGKVGLNKVKSLLTEMTPNGFGALINDFTEQTQWQGVFGEFAEEMIGGALSGLVGIDDTLNKYDENGNINPNWLFEKENMIDTFLGVAILGGAISAAKTVGYTTPETRYNREITKAKKGLNGKISEEEMEQLEAFTNNPMGADYANLAPFFDKEKSEESKLAVGRYLAAVMEKQGYQIAKQANMRGTEQGMREMQQAFQLGQNMTETDIYDVHEAWVQAMQNLNNTGIFDVPEGADAPFASPEILDYSSYEVFALSQDSRFTLEERRALKDLAVIKNAKEGLEDALNKRASAYITANNAITNSAATNGVVTVGMHNGKKVYVKGGVNVSNGSIVKPDFVSGYPVEIVDSMTGEVTTVDSSEISNAQNREVNQYNAEMGQIITESFNQRWSVFRNTKSTKSKLGDVEKLVGQRVYIDNGQGNNMTEVEVMQILPNGEVVLKGKKGDLGGQSVIRVDADAFYDSLTRDANGNPIYDMSKFRSQSENIKSAQDRLYNRGEQEIATPEAEDASVEEEVAEVGVPSDVDFRGETIPIMIGGVPVEVEVTSQDNTSDSIAYTYIDENGDTKYGSSTIGAFMASMDEAKNYKPTETATEIPTEAPATDITEEVPATDNGPSTNDVPTQSTSEAPNEEVGETKEIDWDSLFEQDAEAYFRELQNAFGGDDLDMLNAVITATQKKLDNLNKVVPDTDAEIFANVAKKKALQNKIDILNGMVARLTAPAETASETPAAPATPAEPVAETPTTTEEVPAEPVAEAPSTETPTEEAPAEQPQGETESGFKFNNNGVCVNPETISVPPVKKGYAIMNKVKLAQYNGKWGSAVDAHTGTGGMGSPLSKDVCIFDTKEDAITSAYKTLVRFRSTRNGDSGLKDLDNLIKHLETEYPFVKATAAPTAEAETPVEEKPKATPKAESKPKGGAFQRMYNTFKSQTAKIASKIGMKDFVSKDKARPAMTGVYKEGGYEHASDSFILARIKADYPSEQEGKVYSLDTEQEINARPPRYDLVIDSHIKNTEELNVDIDSIIAYAQSLDEIKKGMSKDTVLYIKVGNRVYKNDLLLKAAKMAKKHGLTKVLQHPNESRAGSLMFAGDNGEVLVTNVVKDEFKSLVDVSDGTVRFSEFISFKTPTTLKGIETAKATLQAYLPNSDSKFMVDLVDGKVIYRFPSDEIKKAKESAKDANTYAALEAIEKNGLEVPLSQSEIEAIFPEAFAKLATATNVAPTPVENPAREAEKREKSLAAQLLRYDLSPEEKRDMAFNVGKAVGDYFATREEYDAYEQSPSSVNLGDYLSDFERGVEESFANRVEKDENEDDGILYRSGTDEEADTETNKEAVEAEMESIKKNAIKDGTFMKAPNGKPTNLTERQWLQVRTKNFIKWFGDWMLPHIAVNKVAVSKEHPFDVTKKVQDTKLDVVAHARKEGVIRTLSNDETNGKGDIVISKTAIEKVVDDAYKAKDRADLMLGAIAKLPELIKESKLGDEHFSYAKGSDGVRRPEYGINEKETIFRYFGAIESDGETYRVKITVKRDNGNKSQRAYTYEVMKIELTSGNTDANKEALPTLDNSISFAKLLDGVDNDKKNGEKLLDFSKVVDENGEPLVVYHGSPYGAITEFDHTKQKTSGLKEFGTYFATNRKVAEMYRDQRKISNDLREQIETEIERLRFIQYDVINSRDYDAIEAEIKRLRDALSGKVYEAFLNIRNPKTFDAKGKDGWAGWKELKQDVGYDIKNGTEAVEAITGNNSAAVMSEKYDGIIANNIADIHSTGYVDDLLGDVFLVWNPTQIKSATDNAGTFDEENPNILFRSESNPITPEMDADYLAAVERGNMETAQRMVLEAAKLAMPNTKVVDENGNPKVVYHGSNSMFTEFDKSKIGSATGTADGRGFYFTTDRDYASGFKTSDGQLFEVFLNIENPLSYDKKTITKAQLKKILKEADKVEFASDGEHYMLSNYANYNDVGIDGAINAAANLEYDYADNDVELVGSLIGGSGNFELIMDAVAKVTGKSSMIAPKNNGTTHYVVTESSAIKSADPVTFDDNGHVIPLSERFNPEKKDIRFRKGEKGFSSEEISLMETPILESKGTFKNLNEAESWAKKHLQGTSHVNQFTHDSVTISGKSIEEMLNPKSSKKINEQVHMAALMSVPEFIMTGIPAEQHLDTHGRGFDVVRLYNAIDINGKVYRVKSTVKKLREGDKYYTYELQEMELIEDTQSTAVGLNGNPVLNSTNSITGANLLRKVKKTNSSEYILQEDNVAEEKSAIQNAAVNYLSEGESKKVIERAVNEEAAKLGVTVTYKTREQMPKGHKNDKGYYNTKTGEIVVCIENASSINDAIQTILHEAVAHKGLRQLMGDRFNEFINRVYDALDAETRAKVDELADKHYKGNKAVVMEEYMASLAETEDFAKTSVWDKIKSIFNSIINSILGRNDIKIGDNELRYILRASYANMVNPRNMDTIEGWAKDVRMREEYKINEASPEIMSRTGIDATESARETAKQVYDRIVNMTWQEFQRQLQDAYQPVRIAIDTIQQETGNIPIEDYENYLLIQNQSSSRSRVETDKFKSRYYSPIVDQVNRIIDRILESRGYDIKDEYMRAKVYAEVIQYLMAKHGLERNKYYQEHKTKIETQSEKEAAIKELQNEHNSMIVSVLADTSRTEEEREAHIQNLKDLLEVEIAEIMEREEVPDLRDYSGLTSLFGFEPKDFREAEEVAQRLVDNFEDRNYEEIEELWKRINAATNKTLMHSYESGLLSRQQYNDIKSMFEYYIPLRGFAETTAEDVYAYARFEGNRFNPAVKKAEGRTSVAYDPIATIMNMAESEIAQGNKNRAKQALYYFIVNRPIVGEDGNQTQNTLMRVEDVWYVQNVDENGNTTYSIAAPNHEAGETYQEFEERMRALEAEEKAYKSKKGQVNLGMRFQKQTNKNAHYVYLKINGVEKAIYINGDPKAADAINGANRPQPNGVESTMRSINRAISSTFTNYSLEFTARNYFRDMVYAHINMGVRESDPEYRMKFRKNWRHNNLLTMLKMLNAYRAGEYDGREDLTADEKAFVEFMDNGGQTGYTLINSVESHKKELEKVIERMQKGIDKGGIKDTAAFKYTLGAIELLNEASELVTRFAAFKTSRDVGRGIIKSIADAKEITVNFNTKGAQDGKGFLGTMANYLGWSKYFFNASVQGVQNTVAMAKANKLKFGAVVAGVFASGIIVPMLTSAIAGLFGDDDEEYWNIPEWERQNNLCLVIGKGKYVKIPLPIGFREVYALGDMVAAMAWDKKFDRDAMQVGMDMANKITSVLLPINPLEGAVNGLSLWHSVANTILPSSTQFLVQNATNIDWKGAPLQKEYTFNANDPQWMKAYASNPEWMKGLSKWCNEHIGAGDMQGWDWSPEKLDNTLSNLFGGIYTLIKKTGRSVSMIWNEENRNLSNIPLAGVAIGSGIDNDERYVSGEYYDEKDYYDDRIGHIKRRAEKFDYDLKDVFIKGRGKHHPKMQEIYNNKEFEFMKRWYLGHEGNPQGKSMAEISGLNKMQREIKKLEAQIEGMENPSDGIKAELERRRKLYEDYRRRLVHELMELN